jgi:CPA2 family monovalent cation:H+ antiporter-2
MRDHDIPYLAIDSDPERFVSAASDGYSVVYGDARDRRLIDNLGAAKARAIVLGASTFAGPGSLIPANVPGAPARFIVVTDSADRTRQSSMGLRAHLAVAEPKGIELAADLLAQMGIAQPAIAQWIQDQVERRGFLDKASETEPEPEAA